jgi:DNA-directed RNA polymerase specialized sigma24 family protein
MSKGVNESGPDELLLRRARSGDPVAVVQFASRFWPMISRVAWSMLGNTPQAIATTEEVLGVALHSSQPPGPPVRLSMYRLAIWLAIIRRRSSRRAPPAQTEIFDALANVDNQDRAAFVLRDVEQLPVSDVAAILEISPAEVQGKAHRATMQLTRVLGPLASASALEMDDRLSRFSVSFSS